ncbi:DMT family transporter [Microbacterium sp. LMI12-1-1.1]|uniref:DMT family transporter n=1 Tax=Microbacterium sp. LMI12-1-1.1 TaxID=3135225 RepID=UPI0034142392
MTEQSSATLREATVLPRLAGLGWGLLGIVAFSFTLPFTRVAVGGLSPLFIGSGRAVVAAALAVIALSIARRRRPATVPVPSPRQRARLAIVAAGVVVGFPLLTSFALTSVPASHAVVVIGLLPAATAVLAVLRGKERPAVSFWVFASLGAVAAMTFASLQNGGLGELHEADLLLFLAVVLCAMGYAEGGLLARELGAWQTVSWALVLAAPPMIVATIVAVVQQPPAAAPVEWAAFAYLAVVSMFLGFFAWYRGLAIGPIAQVSQVQLVQPVLGILWSAVLLHERIGMPTLLGGLAVIACAGLAVRTRLTRKDTP